MKSCRQMMESASHSLESASGWWPRLRMHLHTRKCPSCGTLSKNFEVIREACRRAAKAGFTEAAAALQDLEGLSPDAKRRLAAVIAEECPPDPTQATVETQKVVRDPQPSAAAERDAAEGGVADSV